MKELVLLVEGAGAEMKLRARVLEQRGIKEILERCNLGDDHQWTRTWRCADGELDLTGQFRVFREVLPEVKPEVENPIYQETVLKTPIDFFGDETPLGWRRKHLRKA